MTENKYNLKVLYVEDENETRKQMVKYLNRRFSLVVSAADGVEGLQKASEISPDIIIADLLMNGIGGIEMLEGIRKNGIEAKILITSALEDSQTILKTVDIGIENYIIKPIDTSKLDIIMQNTAESILKQRGRSFDFLPEQRKEIESSLRLKFSALLKKRTGKGPRNIGVFLGESGLEITVNGALTPLDLTLLQDHRNQAVIEEYRRLFYSTAAEELESAATEILGVKLSIDKIEINAAAEREKLHFIY